GLVSEPREGLRQKRVERRTGGEEQAEASRFAGLERGEVLEMGRHADQHRRRALARPRPDGLSVKWRAAQEGRPADEREQDPEEEAVDVLRRQRGEDAVAEPDAEHFGEQQRLPQQLGRRLGPRLWCTGAPRGEEDRQREIPLEARGRGARHAAWLRECAADVEPRELVAIA